MVNKHPKLGLWLAVVICGTGSLLGCNAWAPVYTLKRQVNEGAIDYGEVMADFADQALLTNIMRAKDNAPLNFNDLASITGAFSLTDTYGFTWPFGPLTGTTTTSSTHKNTFSPTIAGTSSPVVSLSTLNTQGFMMTVVQPISTTYVLSKWNSYPHDFLLHLFVKSIRFPGETDWRESTKCDNSGPRYECEKRKVHRNDPDSPDARADFGNLVARMLDKSSGGGDVDMKSLMILDPLGNPVPMGKTVSATTPIPSSPAPPSVPKAAAVSLIAATDPTSLWPLPRGKYFVQLTFSSNDGETKPSPEEEVSIDQKDTGLLILPPPKLSKEYTGYNVYVATSHGGERKQNEMVLPFAAGTKWAVPTPLKSEQGLKASNMPFPRYPGLSGMKATYYIQITYATNSGGETAPTSEFDKVIDPNKALEISVPQTTLSGIAGYNVYVGPQMGQEQKQNREPLDLVMKWTKNYDGVQAGPPPPAPAGTSFQVNSDFSIFQTISGLGDGQLHAGNAGCPDFFLSGAHTGAPDICEEDSKAPLVQFYKEYPGQVVLCVNTDSKGLFRGHRIAPISQEELAAREELEAEKNKKPEERTNLEALQDKVSRLTARSDAGRVMSFALSAEGPSSTSSPSASGSGGPQATGAAPGGGGGGAGAGGAGAGAMGQVTLALQPNRISAMIFGETCDTDQIVLPQGTEVDFQATSGQFTHVEWRSIAEVIHYLGALARYEDFNGSAYPLPSSSETLFGFAHDTSRRVHVKYRGDPISVGLQVDKDGHHVADPHDHSLEALAMLNELISLSKISGNLAAPQTVTVLP